MAIRQCTRHHFYDDEKYKVCPICLSLSSQNHENEDRTVAYAKLLTVEDISGAETGKSLPGWIFLIVFFVLIIAAAITGVYTMRWVTLTTNLVGVLELLAVFFLVFKNRFNENGVNLSTGSRVVPAMTAVLIALLVIAAILSVA